jgi:hypothetical protein
MSCRRNEENGRLRKGHTGVPDGAVVVAVVLVVVVVVVVAAAAAATVDDADPTPCPVAVAVGPVARVTGAGVTGVVSF